MPASAAPNQATRTHDVEGRWVVHECAKLLLQGLTADALFGELLEHFPAIRREELMLACALAASINARDLEIERLENAQLRREVERLKRRAT